LCCNLAPCGEKFWMMETIHLFHSILKASSFSLVSCPGCIIESCLSGCFLDKYQINASSRSTWLVIRFHYLFCYHSISMRSCVLEFCSKPIFHKMIVVKILSYCTQNGFHNGNGTFYQLRQGGLSHLKLKGLQPYSASVFVSFLTLKSKKSVRHLKIE
jgi:hypothetical protein